MNKLTKEILELFDEKWQDLSVRTGSAEHYDQLKSFLQEVVKRAYEEGQEDVRDCVRQNLFSHRNRLCECYKSISELNKKEE